MKIGSIFKPGVVLWISQSYKPTHQALDFGNPTGKAGRELCAVEDGVVVKEAPKSAPQNRDYGFVLRGDSKALYFYNHCVESKLGRVKRGEIIGKIDTVARQNLLRKKWGAPPLKPGHDHCHFEIHPTRDWNLRDQPLCYFDRNEVKYNKQPACTSTPLDYAGIADKHLPGGEEEDMIKLTQDHLNKIRKFAPSLAKSGDGEILGWFKGVGMYAFIDNNYERWEKINELNKKLDDLTTKAFKCTTDLVGAGNRRLEALERAKELKKEIRDWEDKFSKNVQSEVSKATKTLNNKLTIARGKIKELDDKIKLFEKGEKTNKITLFFRKIIKWLQKLKRQDSK